MTSPGGGGDLGTLRGKIVIDANEAEAGIKKAQKATEDLQKRQADAAAHLKSVGADAARAYGVAVVGGFALAVNAAKNFEQSLANVAAAGGKSAADRMDDIRKKALQLGADTKFSSVEAANAMEVLIKAGLTVDDVLNGAADAAVALAAAEGISIPEAAETAAVAMTAFNLKAAELPAIANKISQAASSTKMDVKDFSYAMNQAGAVSKLVGLSFDDMTLAITAMGKAGIVGSDAGTSLKTMLMNLQPGTIEQTKLFKQLGLITKDGANQFFDATGKIKSMTDIAGVLQTALQGMTQQQKFATLETLFGADAIRAAAIISEQGAQGMRNLTAEMTSQLSVAEKAKIKQDTLSGALEKMKGSIESAGISFGTGFIPVIRTVAEFIDKLADGFSKLPGPVQQGIGYFLLGSTALLGFGFGLVKTINLLKEIALVLNLSGAATAFANGMRTLGAAITMTALQIRQGIVAISAWVAAQTRAAAVAVASAARMTASYVAAFAVQAAGWIRAAAVAMANALIMAAAWLIANPWALIIAGIIALVAIIIANWDTIKGWLLAAWEWIKDTAARVWNAIKQFFIDWWPVILGVMTGGVGLIIGLIIKYWDDIKQWTINVWNSIKAFFVNLWNSIWMTVQSFAINIFNTIVNWLMNARNTITQWIDNVVNFFRELPGKVMGALRGAGEWLVGIGQDMINGLLNGIRNMASRIGEAVMAPIRNAIDGAKRFLGISSPSKLLASMGQDTGEGYVIGVESKEDAVRKAMEMMATGGMSLTGPTSPFAHAAQATTESVGAAPLLEVARPNGPVTNINIDTVSVPVSALADPTNSVEWRKMMSALDKGLQDYVRSYR